MSTTTPPVNKTPPPRLLSPVPSPYPLHVCHLFHAHCLSTVCIVVNHFLCFSFACIGFGTLLHVAMIPCRLHKSVGVLWGHPGFPLSAAHSAYVISSQPGAGKAERLSVFRLCLLALWNFGVGVRQSVGVALLFVWPDVGPVEESSVDSESKF